MIVDPCSLVAHVGFHVGTMILALLDSPHQKIGSVPVVVGV